MTIGEVTRRSGLPAPTIRYYEAQKLIARPARTSANYRVYSARVLDELTFIRRAQRLGLTLAETREILSLGRAGKKPCSRVAAMCATHLSEIERQIDELRAFQANLREVQRLAQQDCGFTAEGFCRAIFADHAATPAAS
jgi:DNA-binding transcriptional MerR regulator